jgi:excisionase family DNA binding protein
MAELPHLTPAPGETVSIMKACEFVGVSRRTIYNWIASGKVDWIRTAGGSIRIVVRTLWRQPNGGPAAGPMVESPAARGAVAPDKS